MGILTYGRHSQSGRPVVIKMCHFVRKPLNQIRIQSGCIEQNVVIGRTDGALASFLRYQVEIVPVKNFGFRTLIQMNRVLWAAI